MYRQKIQYKVDNNSRTPNRGLGISLPYNNYSIFNLNYTTKDQTKSNLMNYMLTNKGERPFNPEFGADLRRILFEQDSDFTYAKDILLDQIASYFPNVRVTNLEFYSNKTDTLNIKLDYLVLNSEDSILIQIN